MSLFSWNTLTKHCPQKNDNRRKQEKKSGDFMKADGPPFLPSTIPVVKKESFDFRR